MSLDRYLTPPDPEPMECLTHGTEECDGEQDDCEPDDGCNSCDAPVARLCRCDAMYEDYKEKQYEDD